MIARPTAEEATRAPGALPDYAHDPIPAQQLPPAAPRVDRTGTPRVDPKTGMTLVVPIGQAPPSASVPVPAPSSQMNAAFIGAGQGLTMGFGDELAGVANVAGGGGSYTEGRDKARQQAEEAKAAHKYIFGGAELLGGVAGAVVAPIGGAARGAGWVAKAGQGAITGAKLGAVSAAGNSTADLTKGDVGGLAKDVALGGVGGAVVGAGASAAGSALAKLSAKSRAKAVTMMRAWFGGGADAEAGKTSEAVRRKSTGGKVVDVIDNELEHDGSAQKIAAIARTKPAEAGKLVDQRIQDILKPRTELYERLESKAGKIKTEDYDRFLEDQKGLLGGKNTDQARTKLKLLTEMEENSQQYWAEKGEIPWLDLREHVSDLQSAASGTMGAIAETERKGMADWRKSIGTKFLQEQMDKATGKGAGAEVEAIGELNDRYSAWKGMKAMLDQRVNSLKANGWKERASGAVLPGQIGAIGAIGHGIYKGEDLGEIAKHAIAGEAVGLGVGLAGSRVIEPAVKGLIRKAPAAMASAESIAAHIFGNPAVGKAAAGAAGRSIVTSTPKVSQPQAEDLDALWESAK